MTAELKHSLTKTGLEINLKGDFVGYDNDSTKSALYTDIQKSNIKNIDIDSSELKNWDSTLVVILFEVLKISKQKSIKTDLSKLPEGLKRLLDLALAVDRKPTQSQPKAKSFLEGWGESTIETWHTFIKGLKFLSQAGSSIGRFFTRRAIMRPIDFMFALEDCSYKAFGIVALISFMVGIIFAFVGAMQLQLFGAQIYVASLVGLAMVRVMGAVMTGIIIAGRTGSSYAATIGTMQVNEEIDALNTMGVPVVDFLLLPRMMALMLMMPLLTLFSDIVGMLGGAFIGIFMLDLAPQEYWDTTISSLSLTHFFVGLFHGFVFGCVVSLCGCYYGINCGRDADSVGKATTNAVVYSIVWIIVSTAVITLVCQVLGI